MIKHIDLFTGYGGFTLAAQKFNIKTIGFSEIDRYATAVLKFRYPNIKNYGDVTKISTRDLPDCDIISGGWPCQDHSVAGRREGLSGKRSGLFYTLTSIIQEKLPSMFILENVKGALSSNRGFDFLEVLNELSQGGYDIQWGCVNAKFWVPQNRERVFVVGCLGGFGGREIFPIEPKNTKITKLGQDISFCLDSSYYKGTAKYEDNRRQLVKQIERIGTLDIKGHDYIKKDTLSNCLTTGQTKECLITDFTKIRRLTPVECERLMGLPDDWTKFGRVNDTVIPISDTQRYKLAGNGVVIPVIEEILERML